MKYHINAVWDRFYGLLKLERKDILQVFYYALFAGVLSLSLPLGVQSIVNLIQGAQISSSWIILVNSREAKWLDAVQKLISIEQAEQKTKLSYYFSVNF